MMPEYNRYKYISKDFERLELLYETREATTKDFMKGRKIEVKEKLQDNQKRWVSKAERAGKANNSIKKTKQLMEAKQNRIAVINQFLEQFKINKKQKD